MVVPPLKQLEVSKVLVAQETQRQLLVLFLLLACPMAVHFLSFLTSNETLRRNVVIKIVTETYVMINDTNYLKV